ncbi:SLC16A12 [Mytilus edulis]|uniref:SLC16A12 n=1 Tax=Mytilus edulis TaxID=6550 RepID=A0A8S3SDP1_MYTED|nr:SLC16A12 [Mytilus edulis]
MEEASIFIPRRSQKDTGWAWIISLALFVLNIGSKLLGNRKLIIIGGFISFSGYLLSAFSPNIGILVLSQSVLYGVGCACTTGPVFVVLNTYFEKHLGFANSFAYVGGSVGSSNINIDGSMGTPETFWTTHKCSVRSLPQDTSEERSIESKESKSSEFCFNQYIIDMTVLRNRKLQLFLFVAFFSFCGSGMIITFIPAFARDNGISNDKITILITIIGGCDLFSRFTLAWITDSQKIRRHHIMGFCLGITGVASMLNPLYTSFSAFIGYSVIYGLFGSIYFSMSILVLRDCVGAENISAALSLMITIHGLSSVIIAPSVGFIRDTTGSYAGSFFLMGSGLILGSVGIFCQPLVK